MTRRASFDLIAVATIGLVFSVACGGRSGLDSEGPAQGGFSGSAAAGGTGGSTAGSAGTAGFGTGGSMAGRAGAAGFGAEGGFGGAPTGAGGVGGSNQCGAQATTECDVCICGNCASEQSACADDPGCTAIVDCVRSSGCSGRACLTACGAVIQQFGGPFGASARLARQLDQCSRNAGCSCNGSGAGGASGSSGVGGSGFGGSGGSGFGGSGGTGGTTCFTCVTQSCPSALQCFQDAACRSGSFCMFQQCLAGGAPSFQCMLGCFNGDIGTALTAFQAFGCIFSQCGTTCGGSGGGFGGSTGGFGG